MESLFGGVVSSSYAGVGTSPFTVIFTVGCVAEIEGVTTECVLGCGEAEVSVAFPVSGGERRIGFGWGL